MAWFKIPPEKFQFLEMFGHTIIEEEEEFMLVRHDSSGKEYVIKKHERNQVWLDDINDAIQLDAPAIKVGKK